MGMNVGSFTTAIVSIVVAVIVICVVAVPIIVDNLLPTTGEGAIDNAGTINTIMQILPVFLIIAVLIAVISLFAKSKA